MYKEVLFEKVRQEDVMIWAGSGLSLSSGYPSGDQLKRIFHDSLSKSEQDSMDINLPLQDITEAIYNLRGGRNHIISVLNKVFNNSPKVISNVHKKISLIPHFKVIVTTNYDRLFENAFENALAIYNESQIAYMEGDRKTKIIKVHGDLSDPNSIVITKSDYNKIFGNNVLNNAIWNQVKAKMSTKSVLFLGYSIEDTNFLALLEDISKQLGENRKEFYFVAPDISDIKQKELFRRNIHYINSTAENLIDELTNNIEDNITNDLQDGKVSADTLRVFMSNRNVEPILSTTDSSFKIKEIQFSKPIEVKSRVVISDKNIAKNFQQHLKNRSSKSFTLNKSALKEFNMWYAGIKVEMLSTIKNIELIPVPTDQGYIDIIFEDGFEVNVYAATYHQEGGVEIKLKLVAGDIFINVIIKGKGFQGKFKIEHHRQCSDVSSEISFYNFLINIIEKKSFTIITQSGKRITERFSTMDRVEDFYTYLDYFNQLSKIEKFFRVKFKNFDYADINEVSSGKVGKLVSIINNDDFKMDLSGNSEISISVKNPGSEATINELQGLKGANYVRLTYNDDEQICLHGVTFDIGSKHMILSHTKFKNLDEVLNGHDELKLVSETNSAKIKYLFEGNGTDS